MGRLGGKSSSLTLTTVARDPCPWLHAVAFGIISVSRWLRCKLADKFILFCCGPLKLGLYVYSKVGKVCNLCVRTEV